MRTRLGPAALAAIVVFSGTLSALAGENVFRFGAAYVEPTGTGNVSTSTSGSPPPLSTTISAYTGFEADGGASFTLGFERRFSDDLGLELNVSRLERGLVFARSTSERRDLTGALVGPVVDESGRGDMTMTPLTVSLNIYLDNRESVDVMIGPVLGMTFYDDARIPLEGGTLTKATEPAADVDVEDDFTYGVVFAVSVPVGEKWDFRGAARWLKTNADFPIMQQGQAIDVSLNVDPIAYEFTFGARF